MAYLYRTMTIKNYSNNSFRFGLCVWLHAVCFTYNSQPSCSLTAHKTHAYADVNSSHSNIISSQSIGLIIKHDSGMNCVWMKLAHIKHSYGKQWAKRTQFRAQIKPNAHKLLVARYSLRASVCLEFNFHLTHILPFDLIFGVWLIQGDSSMFVVH